MKNRIIVEMETIKLLNYELYWREQQNISNVVVF